MIDLNTPAGREFVNLAQEIWGRYIREHTREEVLALKQRVAEKRELIRRYMPAPTPIPERKEAQSL